MRPQFILASASARRKCLLAEAGFKFEVIPSDVDESAFCAEGISSIEYAEQLALAKANDVARAHQSMLVIGADTIVDFNGKIIGKPEDHKDARQITEMLFSAAHKVITALAFVRICDATRIVEAETTIVYPKKLTRQQIDQHIKNGDWRGKAGAYGIQEAGDEFVERIEGSFTNVIGLPMELLGNILKRLSMSGD